MGCSNLFFLNGRHLHALNISYLLWRTLWPWSIKGGIWCVINFLNRYLKKKSIPFDQDSMATSCQGYVKCAANGVGGIINPATFKFLLSQGVPSDRLFFLLILIGTYGTHFWLIHFQGLKLNCLKKQFLQCRNFVQLYKTKIVILLDFNNSCEFMLVDCNDRSEYSGRALQCTFRTLEGGTMTVFWKFSF